MTGDQENIRRALLDRVLRDQRAGTRRSAEEYAALFPGNGDLVRKECERLFSNEPHSTTGFDPETPATGVPMGVGSRLGHYELEALLGRGGQGVVYRARDCRLGRTVALKVLLQRSLLSGDALQRFQREAAVAASLDHPHVCSVFEAGIAEGTPFIAMQYIEGGPWSAILANDIDPGSSPQSRAERVRERVGVIETVARALHACHETGILHRDVKPGSILLANTGEAVLLDFGLASPGERGDKTLTHTGDFLGTPAYMSPEQVRGDWASVDRRSDVYSLATTLFEAVAGRRPFEAESNHELLADIQGAPVPNPRKLNPAIPRDLVAVLEMALEKEPRRRYQTAHEFADDLVERARGEVTDAHQTSTSVGVRAGPRPSTRTLPDPATGSP